MKPLEFICFVLFGLSLLGYVFWAFEPYFEKFKKKNQKPKDEIKITISVKEQAEESPRP